MKTTLMCFFAALAALSAVLGDRPLEIVYSSEPQLLDKLQGPRQAHGVTSLGDEVFVVWQGESVVTVYEVNTWTPKRTIPVPGLQFPNDIVSSVRSNALYISDNWAPGSVFRVDLTDGSSTSWSVGSSWPQGPDTLSVTAKDNIIVNFDAGRMKEYTQDGQLVREISFDNIQSPSHTVQLPSGELVVSHTNPANELCITKINDAGNDAQCYTGLAETGLNWNGPHYMVVDRQGQVMATDTWNNRVLLLSHRSLALRRELIPASSGPAPVLTPARMFLDGGRGLLYVSEWLGSGYNTNRVSIYKVIDE